VAKEAADRGPGHFGTPLRRLRLARGLTQEELAERARLSVRGISDLERGIHPRARPDTLVLLAEALDLQVSERAQLDRLFHAFPARRPADSTRTPNRSEPGDAPPYAPHNNLPRPLTSFVGRERELVEVKRFLASSPLVTLTGAGGCGRPRLSLEVASGLVESYADGAWLVELAHLSDAILVAPYCHRPWDSKL
jgi:transcriptional regulator with XRE-family HTH domain